MLGGETPWQLLSLGFGIGIFMELLTGMGTAFGLEHALWFADRPEDAHETPTFRRSNAFEHVAREVRAVREHVGAVGRGRAWDGYIGCWQTRNSVSYTPL